MKRISISFAAVSLIAALGVVATPAANAVNCNAFNKGTATAAHDGKGTIGKGIYMIADACHAG